MEVNKEREIIISLDDAKDNQENYFTGTNVSNTTNGGNPLRYDQRDFQFRKNYSNYQRYRGHNPHHHYHNGGYNNGGGHNGRWDRDYYPRRNYFNQRYYNGRQGGGQTPNPNNHHHHPPNDNSGDTTPQENGFSSNSNNYYSYPPQGQGHQHQRNLNAEDQGGSRGGPNSSFEHFQSTNNNRFFTPRRGGTDVPPSDILSPQNQLPFSHFFHPTHDPHHLPQGQVFNPFLFPELQIPPPGPVLDVGKTVSFPPWDPDAMEESSSNPPAALSPSSIQNNSRVLKYPPPDISDFRFPTEFDNRTSSGSHQMFIRRPYNGYGGKPFHFHNNRWRWNQPNVGTEDLMTRFQYIDEADKPDEFGPPGHDHEQLSEQIWTKFQTNQQTRETFTRKMELWRDLSDCVRKHNSNFRLEMVGSTISGFGTNTSDVDMCLILFPRDEIVLDPRREAIDTLENLIPFFEVVPHLSQKELILAKVPILKLRETMHGIDVDINVNNSVGMHNSLLLHSYGLCDWRVRPLVIVVKLWAHAQGINDAKQMTLSSYSLSLMVIHFLQHGVSPQILPCLQITGPDKYSELAGLWRVKKILSNSLTAIATMDNTESLGELLLGFLEYYAVKFDYRNTAISVRNGATMSIRACSNSRAPKNDTYQWKHICIEEPFEFTNTARSVFDKDSFDRIRGVFFSSWQRLLISRDLESIFQMISPGEARSIGARAKLQQPHHQQ